MAKNLSILNKDELRDASKENFLAVLENFQIKLKRHGKMCHCPSLNHEDSNASCQVNLDGRYAGSVHCHGCGYSADAYKLASDLVFGGREDDMEVWEYLAPIIGVSVEYSDGSKSNKTYKKRQKMSPKEKLIKYFDEENLSEYKWLDYTEWYKKCHKNLLQNDIALQYLYRRGLTLETIKRLKLGYSQYTNFGCVTSKGKSIIDRTPRVIVPVTRYYFLGRDIRPNLSEKEKRYEKMKPAKTYAPLFNIGALKQDSPVFIVEGEFDAISIMQCGYEAIAIGGCGQYSKLVKALFHNKTNNPPIILALDADEAGRKTTKNLMKELKTLELREFGRNAFYCNLDVDSHCDYLYGDCKDANEALQNNPERLKKALGLIVEDALKKSA